ncbi:DNA repair protein [Dendrothele bispora CBS 962.96]|uniref:DNA repair protein REV1 n=1 Tax=Dendrothele bispora (strain CBS 962.96) TaxID=1314807 RepID=A0A4S8KWB8_DENBC|nr:DNA repair protein [Dendrothele bispora CBS 962.96]
MAPSEPSASNSSSDYFETDDPEFLEALQNTVLPGDLPTDEQQHASSPQPSLKRSYQVFEAEDKRDDRNDIYGAAHFGEFGEYMQRKRAKLQIQNAGIANDETLEKVPQIFNGISIYITGRTTPSLQDLRTLIVRHGGVFQAYLDKKTLVTHIVTCSLTPAKVQEFKHLKVVRPEWLVESAKQGILLPWRDFIYRPTERSEPSQGVRPQQKSLLDSFPSQQNLSSSSTLQKKPPRPVMIAKTTPQHSDSPLGLIYTTDPKTLEEAARIPSYAAHKSNPNAQRAMENPVWRSAHTSIAPDFIEGYYKNSRLHHLSSWKAELKSLLQEAQERADKGIVDVLDSEGDIESSKVSAESEDLSDLGGSGVSMRGAEFVLRSPSKGKEKGKGKAVPPGEDRVIMHCDFDCFFVSAGLVNRPQLKGKPVVVCHSQGAQGGTSSTSEVASASYEARAFGIKNGMSLQQVRKLCPDIVTIPYEFELYKQFSLKFYTILMKHADDLQAVSVDEALIDVTSTVSRLLSKAQSGSSTSRQTDPAKDLAETIRTQVRKATRCEVSIGVAHNILLSRLATRRAKPAGSYHLLPVDVNEFLAPLDISDLHGFGRSAKQKALEKLGTTKLGELREKSKSILCGVLGKSTGETLYNAVRGVDDKKLESDKKRKSVSCDINYGIRFENNEQVEIFVHQMAGEVMRRMEEIKVLGRSITLKIMKRDPTAPVEPPKFLGHGACDVFNKQTALLGPNGRATSDSKVIGNHAWRMLKSFNFDPKELRGIGIQIQKLEPASGDVDLVPGQGKLSFHKVERSKANEEAAKARRSAISKALEEAKTAEAEATVSRNEPRSRSNSIQPPTLDLPSFSQVDKSVFEALPEDIRSELEVEYKRRSASPFPGPATAVTPISDIKTTAIRSFVSGNRTNALFPFPRKIFIKGNNNSPNLKRITQQLAPRSAPAYSPNKKNLFTKRLSLAAWKVPERELRKLNIDPEVFAMLPRNIQREQITAARLIKNTGAIPEKSGDRVVLKPRKIDHGEVFRQPPPKARHVPPPLLKQQGKDEKLYFSETDDVQNIIEQWITRFKNHPPNNRDVDFFAKWLVKNVDREVATDEGLARAIAVMKWWFMLVRRHFGQHEYGRLHEDEPSKEEKVGEAWWTAFRSVKDQMDAVATNRFGGKLSLR